MTDHNTFSIPLVQRIFTNHLRKSSSDAKDLFNKVQMFNQKKDIYTDELDLTPLVLFATNLFEALGVDCSDNLIRKDDIEILNLWQNVLQIAKNK